MAIRARFIAVSACFLGVLQPSASWSACAGPDLPPSDALESTAVTPAQDLGRPPSVDAKSIDVNSETRDPADDASVWIPADYDPWAHAFAESSRLQNGEIAVSLSPYDIVINPEVQFFVDRFTTTRRDVVGLWFQRSAHYLRMIRPVFRSKGLPDELAYTAMIESGFNPLAVSRVGAKGLWQFMSPTARLYGLRVDRWVDERLDPEKSTVAAAAYLRDLHARYGSWHLAQAAYNAGSVRVDQAVRKTGSADFWTLARTRLLKRETKDFVPAIHAVVVIGRDPGQYGFESEGAPAPVAEVDRVTVPPGTDLRRLSTNAGVPVQTLRSLNPVLIRGVTPPDKTWELRVPAGTRETILAALAPAPRKRLASGNRTGRHAMASADLHTVRPRDTVSSIAKLYGVSVSNVVRWNNLENGDAIRPGDRLRVSAHGPSRVTAHGPSVEPAQGGFR
jgi:membrane-bound lytic murein transglycosylase D